jgi:hypothetical protein
LIINLTRVSNWHVKLKKNIPPILFTFMVDKTIKS